MEQETKGTQGSSQGGGLVPDVLGQVGAGAIPSVLPVQRGSEGVSNRPTPETDALKEYLATRRSFVLCDSVMWTDHARRLERERDEAREELQRERVRLNHYWQCQDEANELRAEVERLAGELASAERREQDQIALRKVNLEQLAKEEAEVKRLREALGKIADLCQLTCVTFEQQSFRATRIAREALAAKEGA